MVWNDPGCCGVSGTFQVKVNGEVKLNKKFIERSSSRGVKYDQNYSLIISDSAKSTKEEKNVIKPPEKKTTELHNTDHINTDTKKALVAKIQRELKTHGYYKMKVDGLYGPGTATAIKAYQQDNNLPRDGKPTKKLLAHLESKKEAPNKTNETTEPQKNKKPGTIGAAFNEAVDEFIKVIFKKK